MNIKDRLENILKIIKDKQIEWTSPTEREANEDEKEIISKHGESDEKIYELSYPTYPDEVFEIPNIMEELGIYDIKYVENIELIQKKNIEELTKEEIGTYLTFIMRRERFSDGCIASHIKDGTMQKLIGNLIKCI